MGYVTWPRPFQDLYVIHELGLATVIPLTYHFTKCEVSISTHYEDIIGDTKYRKLGDLG